MHQIQIVANNSTSVPTDCLSKSTGGKTGLGLVISHRKTVVPKVIRPITAGVGSGENKS